MHLEFSMIVSAFALAVAYFLFGTIARLRSHRAQLAEFARRESFEQSLIGTVIRVEHKIQSSLSAHESAAASVHAEVRASLETFRERLADALDQISKSETQRIEGVCRKVTQLALLAKLIEVMESNGFELQSADGTRKELSSQLQ